ncbi:MAG: hypothetical protein JNL43_09435 [Flavobacteriales bacterium]|nr:hypothetical protein [Flavobacteriales bacterium]
MRCRAIIFVLLFVPLFAAAQTVVPFNAPTQAVLLANRPAQFTKDEWLRMMEQPVNRTMYPLHITQAMLDTVDGRLLDMRFQYVMVKNRER